MFLGDYVMGLPALESCPINKAAYLEIFNLLHKFEGNREVFPIEQILASVGEERNGGSHAAEALLRTEEGIKLVQDTTGTRALMGFSEFGKMREHLLDILSTDTNTACRMLEVMTTAWDGVPGMRMDTLNRPDNITPELCRLYAEVCHRPAAPEVRAQALLNLASLVDKSLRVTHHRLDEILPSAEELDRLWTSLQRKGEVINPTLACAILKASGSLMAAALRWAEGDGERICAMERRLRNWGVMIADSLDFENVRTLSLSRLALCVYQTLISILQTFDTRIAATEALKSFFTGSIKPGADIDARSSTWSEPKYLSIFSALYDSLIDDDDEVREVAASAAAAVAGRHMVAPEAADNLVALMGQKFGDGHEGQEEFARYVVYRLVGQQRLLLSHFAKGETPLPLTSAEELLQKAMDFDDSLFAAEEQNLFIDEVRETLRWREHAFSVLVGGQKSSESLVEWTRDGLEYILRLVSSGEKGEGPLGWTSDQHVFAICARVVLCAGGIVRYLCKDETAGDHVRLVQQVGELLEKFKVVGEMARVHGSLLEMARL